MLAPLANFVLFLLMACTLTLLISWAHDAYEARSWPSNLSGEGDHRRAPVLRGAHALPALKYASRCGRNDRLISFR
jgi:hypothetical protein